jgi:hypothetical protein
VLDSVRRIGQNLIIRGEQIPIIYGWYVSRHFVVNRRYQRKLVWTIEEKKQFVDSLIHGYPVPLILLAEQKSEEGDVFEILDGMQRLNAIVSFIEGRFDRDGRFFDLNTMVETKSLFDVGELEQRQPTLERSVCNTFARYTMALSIFAPDKQDEIDDVFRRINANGRILSQQDLRAAGAIGRFANLARKISATVRGDVSYADVLPLNGMNQISITNRELDYGILVDDIFWVKQNVLTRDGVRESRDEELVADLLANILLPELQASQTRIFHEYYGVGHEQNSQRYKDVESAIATQGEDVIESRFLAVYDSIRKVVDDSGKTLDVLMFNERRHNGFQRYFQVVFLAISAFMHKERKEISDYNNLTKVLGGIGNKMSISGGGRWSAQEKTEEVKKAKRSLRDAFRNSNVADPSDEIWTTKLEKIMRQSLTEQSVFDFKQGFCRLEPSRLFDDGAFADTVKTATAIANLGPNVKGYIVVGVLDRDEHVKRFTELSGSVPVAFASRFICGIESEASVCAGSLDRYFQRIVETLKREPISSAFAAHIAEHLLLRTYKGRSVLIFDINPMEGPVLYDDHYWTRHGPSTVKVPMLDVERLVLKFSKEANR